MSLLFALLLPLSALAAPPCADQARLDALEKRIAAGKLLKQDLAPEDFFAVIDRRLEQALRAQDPKACAPLKALRLSRERGTGEDLCVDVYHGLRMGQGIIDASADFPARCGGYLSLNPELKPGAAKACAAIFRHRADPRAGCPEIAPLIRLTQAHCVKTSGHYVGDASLCAKLVGPGHGEDEPRKCVTLSAYHKRQRSKDAAACDADRWCRWLAGDFSCR